MNHKALVLLVAAAMVGTMMLPSAAAVHGSRYMAVGIAFKHDGLLTPPTGWLGPTMMPADGEVHRATVLWTGYNPPPGMPRYAYEVTITDTVTGETLLYDVVPGLEQWGCCYANGIEYFQYHGCHGTGSPWSGGTCLDGPDFDLYGLQLIHIQTQQQVMLYSGWYEDWGLHLVVEGHVDDLLA